jgi:hypothetical protein
MLSLVIAVGFIVPTAGCHNDSGLKPEQEQMATRLDELAKQTGGDWSKLSAADKDYLVNKVSMGNEQSARMLLMSKSGKLQAHPGGPPGQPAKQ